MRIRKRAQQGVALVTVVLLLLVLTVLGVVATYLMTQEDRLSSRQELSKEAFYAAEAGLRHGERVLGGFGVPTAQQVTTWLQNQSTVSCPATSPPIPVHPPVGRDPNNWTTATLGTYLQDGGLEVANRELPLAVPSGINPNRRVYYSLYVRNNPEDLGNLTDPVTNQAPDLRIRLVSVGFVTDGEGVAGGRASVLAVRMLEEELSWGTSLRDRSSQVIKDSGGTGSGLWSGIR
ncbi:MAG TPA: PilX N-terminal domain-containing pilus assembly protein [Thermoanaerobaculaceae bacterium]|nr:PilX N-terminal domain-containing pilus assembly protein [Thermoanaerobaculaceae bacterium]HRS15582.1 PilX N-terminal domain-containing pilus assembly protein [Thermoanaerobaculaceae bacterium]